MALQHELVICELCLFSAKIIINYIPLLVMLNIYLLYMIDNIHYHQICILYNNYRPVNIAMLYKHCPLNLLLQQTRFKRSLTPIFLQCYCKMKALLLVSLFIELTTVLEASTMTTDLDLGPTKLLKKAESIWSNCSK